jgi:ComF family protein
MARPLSRLVAPAVGHWLRTLPWDQPWLVPVPLHRRRLAERGYNQAGLLARLWGQRLGLPVRHGVLRRVRATAAQAELAGHQRHRNMQGAFRAQGVAGRDIILVDDVVTSMATAEAATEALLAAEAASVSVLALARGGLDRSP